MPRVKQFAEEEVLQKALQLFWKQGYHATSMQDLVSNLGINRASLYDTFGGKRELFDRAFAQYRKKSTSTLTQFLSQHQNVKDGFRKLYEQAVDETVCDPDRKGCFAVNVTTEFIPGDEAMQKVLEANQEKVETIFYDFLKSGVETGEIPADKDLQVLAAMLYTLYNGLRVVSKVQPNREKLLAPLELALSTLD